MTQLREEVEAGKAGQQQAEQQAKAAVEDRELLQQQLEDLGTGERHFSIWCCLLLIETMSTTELLSLASAI